MCHKTLQDERREQEGGASEGLLWIDSAIARRRRQGPQGSL